MLHFEQQVAVEQWWTKNTFIYVRSPCPLRSFSNSARRSCTEKDRTRHEKQRRSEALCLHQVQRQLKRKCGNYQSKLSPKASSMRGSGKQRRTVGDPEREVLLPVLQNTVIGLLRNDTRLTATQEWKMQVDFHLKDALRWPNRGTLAEYIEQHFGSRTCSGTILEP